MSFCHQCGAEVQVGDLFCGKCGEQQRQEVKETGQPGDQGAVEQHVTLELRYRGVGIRFVATIIDGVICLMIFGLVGSVVASMVGGTTPDGFEVQGAPALAIQAITLLLSILYYTLLEAFWNGQTLGKKIVRIQVLNEDGSPISFSTSLLRNILRIVDAFCIYLVAAISIWLSPRKQRVGDRVAKTCVVKKLTSRQTRTEKKRNLKFTSKDNVFISDID